MGTAMGDHLWQSTLVLLVVALLAFALKENQARVRYWLWLAASLKFLIPFCLVVTAGQRLAPSSAATNTQLHQVVSAVGYAFAPPILETGSSTPSIQVRSSLIEALSVVAGLIWFSGFAVIFLARYMRWRNLSAMIKRAVPLHAGREVEALRRVGDCATRDTSLPVLLSSSSLEPGIFGVVRPVLVWPEGISKHLDDSHLDAIVAHELWHVRRRDNLVATVHMLVEALFWFHPLVWWVGAKMVEERERACDEQVLELGSERHVYAESILRVCEFCAAYPVPCVSRVTGADLKKRIVHIMSRNAAARKLELSTKALLGTSAGLVILAPVLFGMINGTPQRVETPSHQLEVEAQSALPTAGRVIVVSQRTASVVPVGSGVPSQKAATKKKVCTKSLRAALSADAQSHPAEKR